MAQVRNHPFNLDEIRVAAPCSADWEKMSGDARARHCALCRKNVYNLSGMSRDEAEALIREKEGKICVRFYRRSDGTVLTDNCPVGLRAIKRRMRWAAAAAVAAITAGGAFIGMRSSQAAGISIREVQPFKSLQAVQPVKAFVDWLEPVMAAPRVRRAGAVMGEVCVPAPVRANPQPAQPPVSPDAPPAK